MTADINRSEWTPPLRFVVNLRDGRYRLYLPPDRAWYFVVPAPPPRAGRLSLPYLDALRRLAGRAGQDEMASTACIDWIASVERDGGAVIDNGGPHMVAIERDGVRMTTPSHCPAAAAVAIERLLDGLFPAYRWNREVAPGPIRPRS